MLSFFALVTVGFASSVINVVAAGGSFLTLPVLIFMGLPPSVANATNRLGVVAQNAGAVWGFHRRGLLDGRWAMAFAVPGLLGAALGAGLALHLDERAFRRALALTMLGLTLWTLATAPVRPAAAPGRRSWLLRAGFFGAGIYAGFIQAGVGFFIVALTRLAGLDLVRGNAAKVLCILMQTALSLLIFASGGLVDWSAGLALASGSLLGGLVGVRLTLLAGRRWLTRTVSAAVVVFAVLLWFGA